MSPISRKSHRVHFALYRNTEHFVFKTREERRSTWITAQDKLNFKKNALRDVHFFRHLRSKNPDADLTLYNNETCSWGLEKSISVKTAVKTNQLKKQVVEAVLTIQYLQRYHSTPVDNPYAIVTKGFNKFSAERARTFGAYRETRVRELLEEEVRSKKHGFSDTEIAVRSSAVRLMI